jgi:hypothetical protein
VIVAEDGIGLPPGVEWPKQGTLGNLVVISLCENAKAAITVKSTPRRRPCSPSSHREPCWPSPALGAASHRRKVAAKLS